MGAGTDACHPGGSLGSNMHAAPARIAEHFPSLSLHEGVIVCAGRQGGGVDDRLRFRLSEPLTNPLV